MTEPTNPYAQQWQTFCNNAAGHRLKIVANRGDTHRHVRMSRPGDPNWAWNIITWPGHLATSGDIAEGYMFARLHDMFEFFDRPAHRRDHYSDGAPAISFDYWAEKLVGRGRGLLTSYSSTAFVRTVQETLANKVANGDMSPGRSTRLLNAASYSADSEPEAREFLSQHDKLFPDNWEYDLHEFNPHFVIACYAIDATVQAYKRHYSTASHPDNFVLIGGGFIQNYPSLPVFDLDVLSDGRPTDPIDAVNYSYEILDLFQAMVDNAVASKIPFNATLADVEVQIEQRLTGPSTPKNDMFLQDLETIRAQYRRAFPASEPVLVTRQP